MRAEELLMLMENPALITAEAQDGLESLAEEYPYFSTARTLLLKGLRATDTELFDSRLATLSAYAPSRKQLHQFLNAPPQSINRLTRQELIDRFIENEPQIAPLRQLQEPAAPIAPPEEADLSDEFFSETLAHIYIKQKKYEKAIKIFNRLCLKYPEKSAYFADQIRFFGIILENQKNNV